MWNCVQSWSVGEPEYGPVPGTAQSHAGLGWLPQFHPANVQQAQSELT